MAAKNIECIAAFNTKGDIKPLYIRMPDDEGVTHTYTIDKVLEVHKTAMADPKDLEFRVRIVVEGLAFEMEIHYLARQKIWQYIE